MTRKSVVLDFMKPQATGGRRESFGGQVGLNEAGWEDTLTRQHVGVLSARRLMQIARRGQSLPKRGVGRHSKIGPPLAALMIGVQRAILLFTRAASGCGPTMRGRCRFAAISRTTKVSKTIATYPRLSQAPCANRRHS